MHSNKDSMKKGSKTKKLHTDKISFYCNQCIKLFLQDSSLQTHDYPCLVFNVGAS